MKFKQKVVRVVLPDGVNELTPEVSRLLESLRYAGLIKMHRDDADGVCFDLRCPSSELDSNAWANQNAERMQSFQYNAVAAPPAEDE